jgi:dipeptidyl aminopeptidase/acylaminoacyl peptidase
MTRARRLGLFIVLLAMLLSAAPALALAQTGAPTVKDEGNNIYLVDGTKQPLPTLLAAEEAQKLALLQSAPLAPAYRIASEVSPDDRTVLISLQRSLSFLDLRDGTLVPLRLEQGVSALTNYAWLDENTLGFLATRPPNTEGTVYMGVGIDRRTGAATFDDPRLSAAASVVAEKQLPALLSTDRRRLLVIDSTNAKPLFGAQGHRGLDGKLAFDALPGVAGLVITEGAVFKVVDTASGVTHTVFTVGPNTVVQDVSFSQNGDKFSLTALSTGDALARLFDGARLPELAYRDALGTLPPAENPFLQGNSITVLDFPSGTLRTLRAADSGGVIFLGSSWSTDNQTLVAEVNTPGLAAGRPYPQFNRDFHSGGSLRFYNGELQEIRRLERPELDSPVKDASFVSPDELIIQTRYGTDGHPYYYNLRSGEFRNIADRAGAFFEVVPTNRSREIVFVYSSFTDPPDYHRMAWDGTAFARLTWFNEEVHKASQTRQYPVSFTLRNGERFNGVLVLPAAVPFPPRNVPIVLWQAGGPQVALTNTWLDTVENPHALLPNFGFGVLTVPLYGRHGLGAARNNALADGTNFGQIDIDAQAEIVGQLRARGWASKVGITGCSYGGYFVTQSVTRHPTTYDAGHTMCSIVDMVTEWSRGDGRLLPWLQGKPIFAAPEEYRRDSPIYQAGNVRTPLLAFHGTKDFLPVAVMENFMSQVIATGTPAKLLKFQDAVHGFSNMSPATLADAYEYYGAQEQILWFRQYLGQ